ncbi:hypothetical protein Tco_1437534 [Tanacetum coccineum]
MHQSHNCYLRTTSGLNIIKGSCSYSEFLKCKPLDFKGNEGSRRDHSMVREMGYRHQLPEVAMPCHGQNEEMMMINTARGDVPSDESKPCKNVDWFTTELDGRIDPMPMLNVRPGLLLQAIGTEANTMGLSSMFQCLAIMKQGPCPPTAVKLQ